jgi:hypothetical protein
MNSDTLKQQLSAHFDVGELKFFPVALTKDKTKAKVGSYIDARAVMDRLDTVLGPTGWQTSYTVKDEQTKAVECQLSIRDGGDWVTRADVGYPNESRDADNPEKEPYKAAYSDALKRAAVQFGIGRYIYSLELAQDWLPVDQYGRFTEQPRLKGQAARPATTPPQGTPQAPSAPVAPAAPREVLMLPTQLLSEIEKKHGLPAKQSAIKTMTQCFGTGVINKLSAEDNLRFMGFLKVRLDNPSHAHEPQFLPNGRPICEHCGEEMKEPALV